MLNFTSMEFFITLVIYFICVQQTEELGVESFKGGMCAIGSDDIISARKSYDECVKLCSASPECVAITFVQKMSLCRLNFQNITTANCPGYVYSSKKNWNKKIECSCPSGQACDSNGQCETSVCEVPAILENGATFGTMRSIGNRMAMTCKTGYVLTGSRSRVCKRDGNWSGQETVCTSKLCEDYLVSGTNGVEDDQLSASSYWCQSPSYRQHCTEDPLGKSAKYGRLHSKGLVTGCWSPNGGDANPFIQVDFRELRLITGIALKGRDTSTSSYYQYVTSFKVLYSIDCKYFVDVQDENGSAKVFDGNTDPEVEVVRMLPVRKLARCVRVSPQTNSNGVALRFDVIGCTP